MSAGGGADLATVGLRIDGDSAVATLDRFERSADRAGRSGDRLEKTARSIRAGLMAMGLALGAGAFLHTLVKNTEEAQYAFAQLEAGVRSTGGAAGYSAPQLAQMASELQKISTFSDEAVEGAQSLLLTFTNIRGDIFKEASGDVLDLAQRMGGDLNGAAIQVGKALQDPIKGVLALRRVGVSFSESQRQVIKDLVDTGHVVDAQRLILKELETEFGGAAAAARNTLGGALKGLHNDFGDLFEVSADSSSGVIGAINDLDKALLFLKDHLDTVQKSVAFGITFWVAYTAVTKTQAIASSLAASVHTASAAAIAEETLAVRAATASIAGYETAAVSAGIASGALGAGAGSAAVGVSTLTVAGEGLISVLTGPVGIALALTTVIALLWNYKSASEAAAQANAQYSQSLAGKTDEQLYTEGVRLQDKILARQLEVYRMQDAHEETIRRVQSSRAGTLVTNTPNPDYTKAVAELQRLQAAYAAVGREQNRRAAFKPPPMVDVSSHPDNSDAIKARLLANEQMIAGAQAAVRLAGEQGMAEQRLRIDMEASSKVMEARADIATRSVLPATEAAIEAERRLKLEAMDVSAFRAQTQAREDSARTHEQAIALLEAEGAAQTRLRIEYEATNKTMEAQRTLEGRALDTALAGIEADRVARLAEEQLKIFVDLRRAARDEMRGLFEDVYNNGVSAFGNLFARAREMIGRLVADMAAKKIMLAIGTDFTDQLARIYGGAGKLDPGARQQQAAVALTGSAGSLTGAAGALTAAAARLSAGRASPPPALPATGVQGVGAAVEGQPLDRAALSLSAAASALSNAAAALSGSAARLGINSRPAAPPQPVPNASGGAQPGTAAVAAVNREANRAALALTGSANALSAAATALNGAAVRMTIPAAPTGITPGAVAMAHEAASRPPTRQLEGITATAKAPRVDEDEAARQSASGFAKAFAKYVAPAMAGYFAGNSVGSGTTNRGLGTLGGAASGAAAGYAVGGPLGAAIGGLSGAIGGFLGASKARAEHERMLREVLERNGERIRELNENISGLSLFAGKNLSAAGDLAKALAASKLFGGFVGPFLAGAFGGVSTKDLAKALQGGESTKALKEYERQFGVTMQDLGRMAKQMGIELFDSAGKLIPAALKQLNEALQLTIKAATQFTGSIEDLKLRQDAYNKLFDVPDTPINKLNDAYEILSKSAPELLKQMGLANLNLGSEAGRKVLLAGLQDIFKLVDAGLLTPDLLGAFKDKDGLIQAILAAKAGLDAFKQSLSNVTTDFPKAMDLIIYEQRYGHGVGASTVPPIVQTPPPPTITAPTMPQRPPVTINFNGMTVVNEAGDTEADVSDKLERGMQLLVARGGSPSIAGVTSI